MNKLCSFSMLALGAALLSSSAGAQARIGAVGDSLTDEYLPSPTLASTDLAALSWVQILEKLRSDQVDFGAYRPAPLYWPDSRHAGYEHNWAKVGAAASDATQVTVAGLLTKWKIRVDGPFVGSAYLSALVTGLSSEIARGEIDFAVVAAGQNDFYYKANDFDVSGTASPNGKSIPLSFIQGVAASVLNAVDRLLAAGNVKVVLALIPGAEGTAANGGRAQNVLNAIEQANGLLIAGAAQRGIPVVDLFGGLVAGQDFHIGNIVIPFDSKASNSDLVFATSGGVCNSSLWCAGPSHAGKYRAEDGLHPNTIIQAKMANQVIGVLNEAYGAGITPLRDDEILGLVD